MLFPFLVSEHLLLLVARHELEPVGLGLQWVGPLVAGLDHRLVVVVVQLPDLLASAAIVLWVDAVVLVLLLGVVVELPPLRLLLLSLLLQPLVSLLPA